MGALLLIIVTIGAIAAADWLALRFGVDSRPESRDPRSPVRGITV